MSPWNYPYLLSLDPLFGAIAAGNCVVLKPSAYAPNTSRAMAELIAAVFPPDWVTVIQGGREQNAPCWSRSLTTSSSPAAWTWARW